MLFSFAATVTSGKINNKLSLININIFSLNFYRQREPYVHIGVVMENFALTLVLTLLYLDIIEGSTGELNFWHPICKITRNCLRSSSHFCQIFPAVNFPIQVHCSQLIIQIFNLLAQSPTKLQSSKPGNFEVFTFKILSVFQFSVFTEANPQASGKPGLRPPSSHPRCKSDNMMGEHLQNIIRAWMVGVEE